MTCSFFDTLDDIALMRATIWPIWPCKVSDCWQRITGMRLDKLAGDRLGVSALTIAAELFLALQTIAEIGHAFPLGAVVVTIVGTVLFETLRSAISHIGAKA
ncbi:MULTISPECIES: hypothetical protein [unclassified Bradyrhizobium]|uniref:hypothetical protein n=1 Tax=unclassified Bradyrhizobium TaxID=2631580 RepID=UPI001FF9DA00|nr:MULTISPECIES: hypothetical protein [unclassified Bradyrhizobium]MCK1710648.1 hypothetical protein [Bradyrhizobium sp. 143]MCK1726635.1 hypothetical protein [Bradyrhizobium sp. 142]